MKYLPFVLAFSGFLLVGCQQERSPGEPVPAALESVSPVAPLPTAAAIAPVIPVRPAPPKGKVLVVAQKPESYAGAVRWRWLIYGDPTWRPGELAMGTQGSYDGKTPGQGVQGLSTAGLSSSPIEGPKPFGEVSLFEYAVTMTVRPNGSGVVTLGHEHTLRNLGSQPPDAPQGGRMNSASSEDLDLAPFDAQRTAKVLVSGEQVVSLPFDRPMLELEAKKTDGTPYKQVFRLKVEK